MRKKHRIALSGGVLCVAILCCATVLFFRHHNAPHTEMEIPEAPVPLAESVPDSAETEQPVISVEPPTRTPTEAPQVIPDEPAQNKDENPSKDTVSTEDENGDVVQTRNWDALKELPEGTDLNDPDTKPQYTNPGSAVTQNPSAEAEAASPTKTEETAPVPTKPQQPDGSPKNGDLTVIDGAEYMYVEGFGWVRKGDGNIGTTDDNTVLSGNKVGY